MSVSLNIEEFFLRKYLFFISNLSVAKIRYLIGDKECFKIFLSICVFSMSQGQLMFLSMATTMHLITATS